MKLLVVCQYFYPEQFRINDVCFHLSEMGHDVTVLTGLPNYPTGDIFCGYEWDSLKTNALQKSNHGYYEPIIGSYIEMVNRVKIIRCKLTPRKTGKFNLVINYYSFMHNASKAIKAMSQNSYCFDRILVSQYSPVTMAIPAILFKRKYKNNVPMYIYCHDIWPESIVSAGLQNSGPIYNIIGILSKHIYKKADKIFISSKNFEKYINEKHHIYHNIFYLPMYAESLYETEPVPVSSDKINLLFAGNIGEMQSVETILYAAKILQDKEKDNIHIHFVGDGSSFESCKELASNLSLKNITFHGRYQLEEMPRFYNMATAFIMTLKDNKEISYTLPNKVQSYLLAGKPIIASVNGESATVIKDANCGLVCPAEDHVALAGIITQFAEEKGKQIEYGLNAKKYYDQNFSIDSFFEKLLTYMEIE